MNELKALPNESWESFVVRVLSNPSLFNMDKQIAISTLLNVDHCLENIRKMGYLLRDIEKAKSLGLHHKFMSESTEEIHTMYKSEELNTLEEIEKELELVYNKLGKNEKTILNLRDNNTMLRKLIREDTRDSNSIETILKDTYDEIKKNKITKDIPTYTNLNSSNKKSVILQISDLHYSFTEEEEYKIVCSYVKNVEINFDGCIPQDITFAFTGDLLNHNKFSKKYTNLYSTGEATTKAFLMIAKIMSYFITKYPNIKYNAVNICGNESDLSEQFMNDDLAGYDNGDYRVYQLLKAKFSEVVNFINEGNEVFYIVTIRGRNIILNHGYFQYKLSGRKNIEDFFHKMQNVALKDRGVEIDFALTSHIHQSMHINNKIFRNSSFEGSNSYSKLALGIADSYRNQNMIVITDFGWHCRIIEF